MFHVGNHELIVPLLTRPSLLRMHNNEPIIVYVTSPHVSCGDRTSSPSCAVQDEETDASQLTLSLASFGGLSSHHLVVEAWVRRGI